LKSDRDRGPIRLASGQGSSLRHKTARRPCPFAFELSGSDQWRLVIAGGQPALAFIVLYSVFKEHLVAESHLAHASHSDPLRNPDRKALVPSGATRRGPSRTSPGGALPRYDPVT
jgi:hypothetical protein